MTGQRRGHAQGATVALSGTRREKLEELAASLGARLSPEFGFVRQFDDMYVHEETITRIRPRAKTQLLWA